MKRFLILIITCTAFLAFPMVQAMAHPFAIRGELKCAKTDFVSSPCKQKASGVATSRGVSLYARQYLYSVSPRLTTFVFNSPRKQKVTLSIWFDASCYSMKDGSVANLVGKPPLPIHKNYMAKKGRNVALLSTNKTYRCPAGYYMKEYKAAPGTNSPSIFYKVSNIGKGESLTALGYLKD